MENVLMNESGGEAKITPVNTYEDMAQDRLTHKEKKQQKVHFYPAVLLQSYTPVVGCYSG